MPENIAIILEKYFVSTICTVFRDFYHLNNNSITVFICDSSDGKQKVLKRKVGSLV